MRGIPRRSFAVHCRRRGFVSVDAVIGLGIVAVLAAALAVAVNRKQHAADRLADMRDASSAAEHALAQMQTGGAPAFTGVQVERQQPGDDAAVPAGYVWVRVRAERD